MIAMLMDNLIIQLVLISPFCDLLRSILFCKVFFPFFFYFFWLLRFRCCVLLSFVILEVGCVKFVYVVIIVACCFMMKCFLWGSSGLRGEEMLLIPYVAIWFLTEYTGECWLIEYRRDAVGWHNTKVSAFYGVRGRCNWCI